ncbi:unnamed protein product [Cylicocyclus nassatus]|uniref:MI domain-containing protein n=1 Tax=Cylicocyclus nassatus TaxID=53992 RepID=A0AA36M0H3_CYLNA|nr:unnamed protein product [Cylicocyclus nassatus]
MGLKKWMTVVKSEHNGVKSSRKQDRKRAKQLRKLQKVAMAKHQPIEKVMVDALGVRKKTKKKKKKNRSEANSETAVAQHDSEGLQVGTNTRYSSSESDSDDGLTYEQYLKEVQDKKMKIAMEEDNPEQDDVDIHRYSKLLGITEKKKATKLKSFANDGLDDLLEFCDSDNRKRLLASSTDQEISLQGGELTDDDDEAMSTIEGDVDLEEDINSPEEDHESVIDENEYEDEQNSEDEDDGEEELQEDIYGRTINRKTGQVIGADPKAALKKLEDLDAKGGNDESKLEIERVLLGTINRLSEGTLVRSHQVIAQYWQNHSKNDVKSCLTRIILRLIGSPYRLQDQLLSLYALFIAHIHAFISEEISAYFVEVFLRDFIKEISTAQTADDKKLENSVVFLANLLHFRVIKMSVIVEVLQKLREQLTVDNLQLVVTLSSYSYKSLRRHYWTAFSEEMSAVSKKLESAVFSGLPRAKFLGETLLSLQKAPPSNIDQSVIEHHLKIFQGLRKKNKVVSEQELGMSLDDILHAEERGRWSVSSVLNLLMFLIVKFDFYDAHNFPENIVQLARKAKMNSEVRRNVFCTIATSDDEDSAFEKLLRLSLKGQQEREIIYVLITMMLKEKAFNPFYPMLIARFCDFDKRFTLTTQYALWDRIREAGSLKARARTRLADLIHYLISHETLSITVLKVVEWGTLSGVVSSIIRRVFKQLSTCPMLKLRRIFSPLFMRDKNPLLSEGLRLFLNVNFPDSEAYKKIEECFAGET